MAVIKCKMCGREINLVDGKTIETCEYCGSRINQTVDNNTGNTGTLLKRGHMALEDGEWGKADDFYEEVLNQDAECAEAYLGKFLAQKHMLTYEFFVDKTKNSDREANYQRLKAWPENTAHIEEAVKKWQVEDYLDAKTIRDLYRFDLGYDSALSCREEQKTARMNALHDDKLLNHAIRYADDGLKQKIEAGLAEIEAAYDQRIADAKREDTERITEAEAAYEEHVAAADKKAEQLNINALAAKDEKEIDRLKAEQEAMLKKQTAEQKAGKAKRTAVMAVIAALICIAVILIIIRA